MTRFSLIFLASSFAGFGFAESSPIQIRSSMSWYTTATIQDPRNDSPYNPDNSVLGLANQTGSIDLRPNLKLDSSNFQLIARPQYLTTSSKTKKSNVQSGDHHKSIAKWTEVFGILTASEKVLVSYGLQNYQWGAAESLNPSNKIFHEVVESKGLLSTIESKNIVRTNLTWSKNFSTILMSETEANKDSLEFRAEESFESKSLMKHEFNWNNGANYIGIVYGAPESGSQWVGEYFNLSFDNGISLYIDAAHQKHSEAWYPQIEAAAAIPNQNTVQMRQSKSNSSDTYTLGVSGLRYSFEDGSDFRIEYILNSAGWTEDEFALARTAVDKTKPQQLNDYKINLHRILKPGLEYRGQKYTLVSLRVPDALYTKDLVLYGRILRSMTDYSAIFYGSLEYSFWSASTFIMSTSSSQGDSTSELRGVIARSYTAGIKQDF